MHVPARPTMLFPEILHDSATRMRQVPLLPDDQAVPAILSADTVFQTSVSDENHALACIAGLYLADQALDQSHEVSQHMSIPAGKYWHGVMHRMEGDFDNSTYWLRLASLEEPFDQLPHEIQAHIPEPAMKPLERFIMHDRWNPTAFIALVRQSAAISREAQAQLQTIQWLEWRTLISYCFVLATGNSWCHQLLPCE